MKNQRTDIQGLRALAVLLVIANHFLGWPVGGFVGVDVFFVISGFLITGHLFRELEREGRVSFKQFYLRRVRRILPAALTVTLVTVVVAFTTFTAARAQSIAVDGIWATLFSANWRLIFVGTDYMHMDDAVSPMQHYWSLSIEEQFYFVWPFVMVAAAWVAVKLQRGTARQSALIAIGLIVTASFAWAMIETATQPTWAYFSTFSRAWELGIGALLALAGPLLQKLPDLARPMLAWAGLLTVGLSALLVTAETPFPGPWAAPAVLGTAAVIAAGTGGPVRFLWPLTNRVSGYIGNISYSLYLWHWPVYVFAMAFLPNSPRRLLLVSVVLTAALSIFSYHFIENPFRKSGATRHLVKPMLSVVAVASILAVATLYLPKQGAAVAVTAVERDYPNTATGDLYRDIDAALQVTEWPNLTPSIDTIGPDDKAPEWVQDGCLANETKSLPDPIENAQRCVYGDGAKTAVLLGDSVGISWLPGLREALPDHTIHVFTMQRCASVPIEVEFADFDQQSCDKFREWAVSQASAIQPDLAISANVSWHITSTGVSESVWAESAESFYRDLAAISDRAVVLQGPPAAQGFDNCAGPGTSPAGCLMRLTDAYLAMEDVDKIAAESSGATFVSTRHWFCDAKNQCPAFTGSTPVIADASHLTGEYSARLGVVIREAVAP